MSRRWQGKGTIKDFFALIMKKISFWTCFFQKRSYCNGIVQTMDAVLWCNGSTSDSGSLCWGSNPYRTTIFFAVFLRERESWRDFTAFSGRGILSFPNSKRMQLISAFLVFQVLLRLPVFPVFPALSIFPLFPVCLMTASLLRTLQKELHFHLILKYFFIYIKISD